jgi:hypothetical protein
MILKENDEHALGFVFHLFLPLSVSLNLDFPCTAHAFFSERLTRHFQCLSRTFPRFAQKLMLLLCRIDSEIASGEMNGSK